MLKLLRNRKTAKKIWIGLGIIILPAFVLWGFGGAMRDKDEKGYVGNIMGRKVSSLEFKDSLSAVRTIAIMRYGDNFREVFKEPDLEAQAWQRIVLIHEAKKLKISASDKEVIETVESYPFFRRNGVFNNKAYNDLLKYTFRLQPRIFEEQTRQNIIINKLYRKITDEVALNDQEIQQGYIKINSAIDPKFKFNEKKFLEEKENFKAIILEEKKGEYFSKFIAGLLK